MQASSLKIKVVYKDFETGLYISHDQLARRLKILRAELPKSAENFMSLLDARFRRIAYEDSLADFEVLYEGRDPNAVFSIARVKYFTTGR